MRHSWRARFSYNFTPVFVHPPLTGNGFFAIIQNCKAKILYTERLERGSIVAKKPGNIVFTGFYGDVLTEKQRDVMEQYYNDDLSLAEIADNFGITRQGVRIPSSAARGILLELEQKVGFAQRYRAVQQGVAQLESLAREVRFSNANSYSPNPRSSGPRRRCLPLSARSANNERNTAQWRLNRFPDRLAGVFKRLRGKGQALPRRTSRPPCGRCAPRFWRPT